MKERAPRCCTSSCNSCLWQVSHIGESRSQHCRYSDFSHEETVSERLGVFYTMGPAGMPRPASPQGPDSARYTMSPYLQAKTQAVTKSPVMDSNYLQCISFRFPPCMVFIQLGFPLFHKCLKNTFGLFKFVVDKSRQSLGWK